MDLLLDYFPNGLTLFEALGLIIFSYFTSAVTATVGIGGGVMMLMAMASIMPITSVIPVHGAVQMGSNGGRAWLMRDHLSWTIFIYFLIGSLIGAAIASQVVVALPKDILRLILGVFVIWIVWGPKLRKRNVNPKSFIPIGIGTTFASMFVGATGLLIGAFMEPKLLGKMNAVSTHAICGMLQHGLKIMVFGLLGFAFSEWIFLILAMVGTGFLGTFTGHFILNKIPEKIFIILFKGLLTLLSARLIYLAIMELWIK